jgi:hypothetical protein
MSERRCIQPAVFASGPLPGTGGYQTAFNSDITFAQRSGSLAYGA